MLPLVDFVKNTFQIKYVEKHEVSYNNITTEFILLCFGYNINKLHSKIQNERTQNHLHELKITA